MYGWIRDGVWAILNPTSEPHSGHCGSSFFKLPQFKRFKKKCRTCGSDADCGSEVGILCFALHPSLDICRVRFGVDQKEMAQFPQDYNVWIVCKQYICLYIHIGTYIRVRPQSIEYIKIKGTPSPNDFPLISYWFIIKV